MKQYFIGDIKTAPSPCTYCGQIQDMAMVVGDGASELPEPGDLSICINCGHLMAFNDRLARRDLTVDEVKQFAADNRIIDIMTALHQIKKDNP